MLEGSLIRIVLFGHRGVVLQRRLKRREGMYVYAFLLSVSLFSPLSLERIRKCHCCLFAVPCHAIMH